MLVKDYPVLFKEDQTGNVRRWHIWLEEQGGKLFIMTESGREGGKQVRAKKEVPRGKAGRSLLEQGELEANRKFLDKAEKGDYTEAVTGANKKKVVKKGKKIRPMLAKPYDRTKLGKWVTLPAFAQRKYDGVRALAYRAGPDQIVLESRTGLPFSHFDHVRAGLLGFYERFDLPSTFYFDGELFTPDIPFEEINGLVRRKTLGAGQALRQRKIKFYVFDFFDTARPKLTTVERFEALRAMFEAYSSPEVVLAPTEIVSSEEEIDTKFREYVAEGYEGLILREMDTPYEIGRRSQHLLKYKEMEDAEFEIVGFEEGAGRDKGAVIWVLRAPNGKTFTARPRGSMEYRRELFRNGEKYLGRQVTVLFQEYSEDGIPRFPVAKAIREVGV